MGKSCMLKSDARQEKLEFIMSSLVESQQNAPVANDSKSLVKQQLCSFIINLVGLLQGASVSTSSIILRSLHQSDRSNSSITYTRVREDMVPASAYQELVASEEEGSWIASSWVLGHLLSACLAGCVNDMIGRKKSLLIDTIVFFLGVARFMLGYPLVSQVYLCEIMSPSRRGLGAAMYSVLHSLGFFLVLILGAFLPWRWAVSVPAFLAVPIFGAIFFLHESPEWLNKMGHEKRCQEALNFYQKDLEGEKLNLEKKTENEESFPKFIIVVKLKTFLRLIMFQYPDFLRNMLFLSTLFLCIGWCGFSILSFYAVEIFQLSGSPLSASNTSWITSTTKIVCSIAAFYVLHKFNRKSLFLMTGTLVCLAFIIMGVFTFLSSSSILSPSWVSSLNFIPMACVILAYTGYGLGYNVIPNIVAAEVMPVEIRSTVIGILMTVEMSSTFVLSKLKPVLLDFLGIHGLFFMFAGTIFFIILLTMGTMNKKKQ